MLSRASLPKDKKSLHLEPTELSRPNYFLERCCASVRQIRVGAFASPSTRDHRIGYALAVIVIVLFGGELLANRFQGGRHVCQRILI
jgi:hypothetical protein